MAFAHTWKKLHSHMYCFNFLSAVQYESCHTPRSHYAERSWKQKSHSENTSNVFSPHYAKRIWKQISLGNPSICVWRNSPSKKWRNYRDVIIFEKLCYQNVFCPLENKKFLQFEERFRIAPFSWRLSVDGRPNRKNKAAFPRSSVVVWTSL